MDCRTCSAWPKPQLVGHRWVIERFAKSGYYSFSWVQQYTHHGRDRLAAAVNPSDESAKPLFAKIMNAVTFLPAHSLELEYQLKALARIVPAVNDVRTALLQNRPGRWVDLADHVLGRPHT